MPRQNITIGLSVHRPEIIPFMADAMRLHDAIFLEEPPDPGFERMLSGSLPVNDYLGQIDTEYPEFSREMRHLLRRLRDDGKEIFQVEPYIETLVGVHEFFAEGHGPNDLDRNRYQPGRGYRKSGRGSSSPLTHRFGIPATPCDAPSNAPSTAPRAALSPPRLVLAISAVSGSS